MFQDALREELVQYVDLHRGGIAARECDIIPGAERTSAVETRHHPPAETKGNERSPCRGAREGII